jgi:gp16 family phage-associated protein
METKGLRTFAQARREFHSQGVSIVKWAELNGFDLHLVYAVLRGNRKCLRGESHAIAVALGVKPAPRSIEVEGADD